MAGASSVQTVSDVEKGIIESIKRTIDEFSENNEDDFSVTAAKRKRNTKVSDFPNTESKIDREIMEYQSQLEKLESRLEETKIQNKAWTLAQLKDYVSTEKQNDPEFESESATVKTLQQKLKLHEQLTGIQITESYEELKHFGPQYIEREQIVQGMSHGKEFVLRYTIVEAKTNETEGQLKPVITDLNIEVDKHIGEALRPIFERVVRNKQVNIFYQVFSDYSHWVSHRKETFNHFASKFPNYVTLPNEEGEEPTVMHFTNHNHMTSIQWSLLWDISVRGDTVKPHISLSVQPSLEAQNLDHKKILEQAPQIFNKMLKSMGIEEAIDTIIRTSC